jgi:DNA-binding SARP family transcriptional activator/ABC-type branched-subunit amino acid transport system substrate-binding protein
MEFRILGPLEVSKNGRLVEIGGRKQRALLAALLLHANEVVSPDRLIDELWGETPPPTAAKTLQAHVSRLRRSLNGDEDPAAHLLAPLETRGPGYVLKVEPGQLDADSFQRLLEDARRALAEGEPKAAAEKVERALALWRGPALADLAYESFAQAEIARLDELRLNAQEERIEADLALGRHRELVGELEALVAGHPLRERLRGQLMLALYRSDRQAEALRVYQQGRLALAEELGLEPSQSLQRLERQILEQDPALAAPALPVVSRAARSFWPLFVLGALVLALAAGAVAFLLARDGDPAAPEAADVTLDGSGVVAFDPRTDTPLAAIPLGTAPANVAVGEGGVWVLDADDRTISRIDPTERVLLRTFSTGSTPTSLAVGAGALWIGNGVGYSSYPASISRIDPESGVRDATIELPGSGARPPFQGGGMEQQLIAVTDDAVWVVNPDETVSRIDPRTSRIVARVTDVRASGIAAGEDGVWIIDERGITEIDPETSAIARRTRVAAESLTSLAVGGGAVWVADPVGGSVWRVDAGPENVQRTIPLELGVSWVAFGEGALWATNEVAGTVHRIEPSTYRARVVSRMAAPGGVAVGERGVWVTSAGQPSTDAALPASACRDVYYGGAGSPRFLIVSDLPLQGPVRAYTLPMVGAIRFVLERRGFTAGPYTVGYQSCDDSTAQAGGFDFYRCFSNAKAYARTPDVLGVIGTFNYGCSETEIPIANQAPDGPLAMISPSNTPTFLTRPVRGMDPGQLEELYPSGERNFVRIAAADHLAAPALVEAAKEMGNDSVAILWDGDDPDGDVAAYAAAMRESAQGLGLELADAAAWNPDARSFGGLARRVAAARPDVVLLTGAAPAHVDSLLRDLRAGLGEDVALIASDGFWGVSGPDARGMYIGNYGIPNAELPPAGTRFLEELEAGGGDPGPDFSAVYGAQAAEILLDAIARSDGTRASVTRELRAATVENGLLGDIRFDRYGDLVEGPVTIFRLTRKGPVVDRVVTVSATPGS